MVVFFEAKIYIETGQIIATSHDLGHQKVAFWKGIPLISGKSRLVKYYEPFGQNTKVF